MKLEQISFRAVGVITFTRRDADLLTHCSKIHYDGVCQQESEQGGTIFSFNNFFKDATEMRVEMTLRKVDTLIKILEMAPLYLRNDHDRSDALVLSVKLVRAFRALQEHLPETLTLPNEDAYVKHPPV